jgi:hypothetical protein
MYGYGTMKKALELASYKHFCVDISEDLLKLFSCREEESGKQVYNYLYEESSSFCSEIYRMIEGNVDYFILGRRLLEIVTRYLEQTNVNSRMPLTDKESFFEDLTVTFCKSFVGDKEKCLNILIDTSLSTIPSPDEKLFYLTLSKSIAYRLN